MTKTIRAQVACITYRQVEFQVDGEIPSLQELKRMASEQAEQEFFDADKYVVQDIEYAFQLNANDSTNARP